MGLEINFYPDQMMWGFDSRLRTKAMLGQQILRVYGKANMYPHFRILFTQISLLSHQKFFKSTYPLKLYYNTRSYRSRIPLKATVMSKKLAPL